VSPSALAAFRSRNLEECPLPFAGRTLVLGMRPENLTAARAADAPQACLFLLGAVFEPWEELADPVLEGADFERTFELLAQAVERLLALYGSVTSTRR